MGQRFVLTSIDIYYLRFPFPVYNVSTSITNHGLIGVFIHHYGILHSILSEQEAHFIAKEVQQCIHAHGINWSYHMLCHLESAGTTEGGMAYWRFSYGASWRRHSWKARVLIYTMQYIFWIGDHYGLPCSQNTCSRNEEVKWMWLLPLRHLITHPRNLSFAVVERVAPKGAMLPPGDTPLALGLLIWKMRLSLLYILGSLYHCANARRGGSQPTGWNDGS